MMKYKLSILGVALTLLFSACFEIEEKVHFNKDGKSGKVEYGYDFTNMMEMLTSIMPDSIKESSDELDGKMKENIGEKENQLKDIKGISNLKTSKDGYKFVVSFDFSDIDALNEAYRRLVGGDSAKTKGPAWKIEKNLITRFNTYAGKEGLPLDGMGSGDEDDEQGAAMVKSMLESAKVRYIYTFDKPVTSVNNESFIVSEDKKSVKADLRLIDIMDKTKNYEMTVKLK